MSAASGEARFGVLGPLQVSGENGVLPISGPRQLALLSVLLLEGGRALSRDRLIDELWGEDPPPTAVNALQVHVAALRRALGGLIRTVGTGYALDVAPDQLDAGRFERLLDEASRLGDHARRSAVLAEALALWRGDAFADVPRTPAVVAAADRLAELRLGATEDRVEADLAAGRHEALVAELRELVAAHADRERLVGQLMLALHRSGRTADALDAYGELAAALDRRLGVDPSDELVALEKAIRRGDPTLAAPLPVSLPAPASRFIGRRRELAETAGLLGRTRLLTLVGPGGCGKTRLAIELAARAMADHRDGAHFVDLAPVAATASIGRAAAAALHVRQQPDEPAESALAAHLRPRRLLLVLDNCEHVAAAAAELSRALLEACPGLRVLATSRQPLGVAGETVWRVPSLALPPADATAAEAAESDAVRLLADRSASALPGHGLGTDDAVLAAAVCRRLDALPLAIELVAGRLPSLSLPEVAALLDRRLALLESAGASPRRRHQTMGAAIDWSHELLEPDERVLFRQLAVFVGGFELAAAEAVAADQGGGVLPVLMRLIDKSMVVADRVGPGATRYRLLETIREYAGVRLDEAGETAAVHTRHADWCRGFAENARMTVDFRQEAMSAMVDAEIGNVDAALEWCLGAGGTPEKALSIGAALWWYWWVRGSSDVGLTRLRSALEAVGPEPNIARAHGLRTAAALARFAGDNGQAQRLGEESLAIYRALDDRYGMAASLNGLSFTAWHHGDYETARGYASESLEQARAAGSKYGEAHSLHNVGTILRCMGRRREAEETLQGALALFNELPNPRGQGIALNNLGLLAWESGDPARARRLALESLGTCLSIEFAEGELDGLVTVALSDVAEGRFDRALFVLTVVERERGLLGVAAGRDEVERFAAAMDAAVAGLDEASRSDVQGEARRTGLAWVVTSVLEDAGLSPSP